MKGIKILKNIGAITVPTTAEEIMGSPVVKVQTNQSVEEAFELMKLKNIDQLAVVDNHDRLVGDVASHELIKAIYERGNNTEVDEIKKTNDYTTFPRDTDLLEIKGALKEVPVVYIADDNKPVGVIKKGDFFKKI